MPQWLLILTMVGTLLPMIQQVVEFMEGLAAGQPGTFKKEQALLYIKAILQGTAGFSRLDAPSIDALMVLAGNLIDTTVAIFNATGRFSKSNPTG